MVKQLIYTSRSLENISIDFVENILVSADRFNSVHEITGLLLYNQDIFMQFLEGPADNMDRVLDRIFNDPRHHNAKTLYTGYSDQRFYPDWSMAALPADSTLKSPISQVYVADQSHTTIKPLETKLEIENLVQSFSKMYLPSPHLGTNTHN